MNGNTVIEAEPTQAKYRFEWRGREFVWCFKPDHFESVKADGARWSASVVPEGWAWTAYVTFMGGTISGTGDTPQNALNQARQIWLNEVTKEWAE